MSICLFLFLFAVQKTAVIIEKFCLRNLNNICEDG